MSMKLLIDGGPLCLKLQFQIHLQKELIERVDMRTFRIASFILHSRFIYNGKILLNIMEINI